MMDKKDNISVKTIPIAKGKDNLKNTNTSLEKESPGTSGKILPMANSVKQDSHKTGNGFDKRQKCMAGLVGILGLVFIFLILRTVKPSLFQTQTAQGDLPGDSIAGLIKADTDELQWTSPELYPPSIRDPMQRILIQPEPPQPVPEEIENKVEQQQVEVKVEEKEEEVVLTVKGIVFSEDNPSVIIENKILFEGEEIQGIKVVRIHRRSVKFEKDGRVWEQQVKH